MKSNRRIVLITLGVCSVCLTLLIGALARQPDTKNPWYWKSDQVEHLVVEQTDAKNASCKRKQSGINVRKWRCDVVRPTGVSVVRISKNGVVAARGQGVPAFVIVSS
jgi:hypothetical protein